MESVCTARTSNFVFVTPFVFSVLFWILQLLHTTEVSVFTLYRDQCKIMILITCFGLSEWTTLIKCILKFIHSHEGSTFYACDKRK